jgi:hypothetical protein
MNETDKQEIGDLLRDLRQYKDAIGPEGAVILERLAALGDIVSMPDGPERDAAMRAAIEEGEADQRLRRINDPDPPTMRRRP